MKFTKSIKVEIEITEELIQRLNAEYADLDDDFHDAEQLENLLDELIGMPLFGVEDFSWDGCRHLVNITKTIKLEK